MKTIITILFAKLIKRRNQKWITNPIKWQSKTFNKLITSASSTNFGQDHGFSKISSYEDFKKRVPVRDYEGLKPYVDRVVEGEKDILWPGQPLYFAKTSGTTSGAKYIPITKESIKTHINSARDALLNYFLKTKNFKPINGKHMFLQG
ncbi:GH3 auxin-responsive promoter family protein, partial [Flavobacteriaceae bacterium]|nr:GH3 auxin-responsive promoter family protein [Flavobacteriaceae bacterium]